MITLVDYHAGNLASVKKAFEHLGCETVITEDPEVVRRARHVVVPGVGHFAAAAQLARTGLGDAVAEGIQQGANFLGICVGMQWMFEGSTEAPDVAGLAVINGMIERFPSGAKVPHVGWNTVECRGESRILHGVPSPSFVYYTHSYRAPIVTETVGITEYGTPFSGVVEKGNVFGVQFHPEKSGAAGLKILENFAKMPVEGDLRP
ncbi:MAG: imidazole glycerol phosphate synthase subunit HisH [Terriglobales bacterium]